MTSVAPRTNRGATIEMLCIDETLKKEASQYENPRIRAIFTGKTVLGEAGRSYKIVLTQVIQRSTHLRSRYQDY